MIEFFHVSDLHFSRKKGVKEFLALIKDKFVIEPDGNKYLLVTGDITDDGKVAQYRKAGEALAPLAGNVRACPGNHDYGNMGFIYHEKRAKYFDDVFLKGLKVNHKYFTKRPFHELLDDKAGCRVLIVGLNSLAQTKEPLEIASGDIGDKQRRELEAILNKPEYAGIPKIVFLHHIPHRRAKGIGMSLKDYKKLMAIVKGKVSILAFGHQGTAEEIVRKDLKKLNLPEDKYKEIVALKDKKIPASETKLRSGRSQEIQYYLDANDSAQSLALYHIKVEGNEVTARLKKVGR
jgi:hypothetical protein